jgi:hypothetical protein
MRREVSSNKTAYLSSFVAGLFLLVLNGIADVFDGFSDFAPGRAEAFPNVAASAVCLSLSLHLAVVYGATDVLFDSALRLIEFSFHLILIW